MNLLNLYRTAERRNVAVECFRLEGTPACSVELNGRCFVGIDPFQLESTADEKVKLAHELGHCLQGGFYRRTSPFELRERCEVLADRWAMTQLMPLPDVQAAMKEGCTEVWQLAERFGVTEEFVRTVLAVYFDK